MPACLINGSHIDLREGERRHDAPRIPRAFSNFFSFFFRRCLSLRTAAVAVEAAALETALSANRVEISTAEIDD